MKINDAIWGAVLLLLAAVILVHVQSFPKIPGQQVGPALFPGLIAAGLGVCALLLVAKGLAARTAAGGHQRWVTPEDWVASPRHLLAFALVIGVNVFYILVVDRIGFIPTGVIYLVRPVPGVSGSQEMDHSPGDHRYARHSLRVLQAAEGPACLGVAPGDRVVERPSIQVPR